MHMTNRENLGKYYISRARFQQDGRLPGVSAFMRVRNEGKFLQRSLESIAPMVDEIVIAVQGEQHDDTLEIATEFQSDDAQIVVVHYPFVSFPNGPCHDQQPKRSVYERSYFYNWTLAQTTRSYALKWDGDMIARPALKGFIKMVVDRDANIGRFYGEDWQDEEMTNPCPDPIAKNEPRLFKIAPSRTYRTGPFCEVPSFRHVAGIQMADAGYDHFKWACDEEKIAAAWPPGWEDMKHFQDIVKKKRG